MALEFVERDIAGRTLRIETGKWAKQAAGSVVVTYGETVVLAAAVTGAPREGIDFFPLTVDYREKTYAAGKFPGGFFKREARPTQKEILTMRMIDRPMRPLFPKGFRDEVLIQTMVLATDQENDGDLLAMIGASASLCLSGLPFQGPIAACRIAYIDGQCVINPTFPQMEYSQMEMVVAGHKDGVNMIEVGSMELAEEIMIEGIGKGHEVVVEICSMIDELVSKAGTEVTWKPCEAKTALAKSLNSEFGGQMSDARRISGKLERKAAIKAVYEAVKTKHCPKDAETAPEVSWVDVRELLDEMQSDVITDMLLKENMRSDGRGAEDIRDLECEVGVLPRVHGSSFFQRGETQSLSVITLGTARNEQVVDGLGEEYSKKFMLHYNFPPLCTGEVKRLGATSRREIGHGTLAEKALEAVLPTPDEFPYTIRLVSEILESNGSSSMASVCAGCLALMDAGVPIRQPVAGISIGMVERDGDHKLFVDILGEEDHFGLMDFKVAGTQRGVTAVQLDLKARTLPADRLAAIFEMAKEARLEILRKMLTALPAPRKQTSDNAPRLLTTKISPEKIGKVIGPGGKYIRLIESETGATVEIENDGSIVIACLDRAGAERALEMVEAVSAEVKIGKIYSGTVSSVKDFGAFIEVTPGQDGLCHISELDTEYVSSAADVVKVGEVVRVKVLSIDEQGRIKLSRKAVALEEAAAE